MIMNWRFYYSMRNHFCKPFLSIINTILEFFFFFGGDDPKLYGSYAPILNQEDNFFPLNPFSLKISRFSFKISRLKPVHAQVTINLKQLINIKFKLLIRRSISIIWIKQSQQE